MEERILYWEGLLKRIELKLRNRKGGMYQMAFRIIQVGPDCVCV